MKTIPKRLTTREIERGLRSLPGWRYSKKQGSVSIENKMKDFRAAVRAIQRLAALAERADHHPDLHLTRYVNLKVVLTTHRAGGVTSWDLRLARQMKPYLPTQVPRGWRPRETT